jgi:hypothetical protein
MGTQLVAMDQKLERVLAKIPDEVIIREAKKRYTALRETKGKYASMKVYRVCKGCEKEFSAREMRTHDCKVAYSKR